MKILWIKTDFLHPTTRGGQIRTLEIVRRLHRLHEIHYVAYHDPRQPEGLRRAAEYCTQAWPLDRPIPPRRSVAFGLQLLGNLWSPLPLAVSRYKSVLMQKQIDHLVGTERFDSVVCDFVFPAPNIGRLDECVLFQHNVETLIWRRLAQSAADPLRRLYFGAQAERMQKYEGHVCRSAAHVIAVSEPDAAMMRKLLGASRVSAISTGVDIDYFRPPAQPPPVADMVFVGSMDWLPNIDGIRWFVREVLPLIRRQRPAASLAIVGRTPPPEIQEWARRDPLLQVSGTVPDVRPYLWGSGLAVVPLRIGGGTRLKIYEAMAARIPVVSTSIGAEGLTVNQPENIRLADTPAAFAEECLALLEDSTTRSRMASAAWEMVAARFSWDHVVREFEKILETARRS